jgi:hypothetical protein
MRNKRLKVLVGLACALICTLFYLSSKGSEDRAVRLNSRLPYFQSAPTSSSPGTLPGQTHRSKKISKTYLKGVQYNREHFDQTLAHKNFIKTFKEKIKLSIELPKNMVFIPLDLEDNIAGIYGTSLSGDKNFAILATDQKVRFEEVTEYLESSRESFPMLKNHRLQPDKLIDVRAPESSGLHPLMIIPSTSHNGRSAYVAFAPRKDGKGSYLFIMSAPSPYFDQNESGLELLLESIKTKP